jgi:putative SOS response-associated peptidase YedK
LYDEWIENSTGEVFNTFTIITTSANDMMAEIHNSARRMPAILDKKSESLWIDLSVSSADALSLLKPSPTEILTAHTIGPLVNDRSANRNTPEVIQPYNYNRGNLLF